MNAYLNDILAQPQALRDTVAALAGQPPARPLAACGFRHIVLTGMGASQAALIPLWHVLVAAGHAPLLVETSELLHAASALLQPDSLLVVVSQSGRSAETVHLLAKRNHATLYAVTNDATSPLAQQADHAWITAAGAEHAVSCKTYLASLATLVLAGADLTGADPASLRAALIAEADRLTLTLTDAAQRAKTLAARIASPSLILCGRGASLAAVHCGALIIKEAAKVHAEGLSSAAFRHGPLELAVTGTTAVIFTGDNPALHQGLADDVTRAGGWGLLVGPAVVDPAWRLPAVAPALRPLHEIIPLQLLSVGLAWKHGREPGVFAVGAKITTVE
jgi:glucosamine--fructose-6-phosphate aminotransferase (isomerizing)